MKLCFECDSLAEEEHHPIPQSLGGTRTIPLCSPCHGKAHSVSRGSIPALTKLGLERAAQNGVVLGRPVKTDRQLMDRIYELRVQGVSFPKIAAMLQAEGVPTVRGGAWYPSTVMAILKTRARVLDNSRVK